MADYKCHSCDINMSKEDPLYDRDWCLKCWRTHLNQTIYQAKMKLKVVEERLNDNNISLK